MASIDPIAGALRIGISACLLGDQVRWDGGHKRAPVLVATLAPRVRFISVCPEVEIGLGTPREPVRLMLSDRLRLVGRDSGADHTDRMASFAARKVSELAALDLDGYILKQGSPSCGLVAGVPVHPTSGAERSDDRGAFAAVLVARLPLLPVTEESALLDAAACERFLERAHAYRRSRRASVSR